MAAVFALHPQHLPCPSFKSKHREQPANIAGCGEGERGSTGPSAGICTHCPPSSQKGTPKSHAVLCDPGMTLRNMSPLVNISCSIPISTSSPMYLLVLLAAIVFPCIFFFSCIQGRESSVAGATFEGLIRSVLFQDGAAVLELTFHLFTSDLPHAVIISHAIKTVSWNDSGPMASTIAT